MCIDNFAIYSVYKLIYFLSFTYFEGHDNHVRLKNISNLYYTSYVCHRSKCINVVPNSHISDFWEVHYIQIYERNSHFATFCCSLMPINLKHIRRYLNGTIERGMAPIH